MADVYQDIIEQEQGDFYPEPVRQVLLAQPLNPICKLAVEPLPLRTNRHEQTKDQSTLPGG
jgi:hypothetical protein